MLVIDNSVYMIIMILNNGIALVIIGVSNGDANGVIWTCRAPLHCADNSMYEMISGYSS
jgi:hypothetical protein